MHTWTRSLVVLALFALTTISSGCASAPQAGGGSAWDRLGTREVNWRVDRDVIAVTAKDGRFSKLQFRVSRAPIEMYNCTVFFRNGTKEKITLRGAFPAGSSSRVIDLPGGDRIVTRVEFTYRKLRRGAATPKVVLYGRH